jgi:hypothetical protein
MEELEHSNLGIASFVFGLSSVVLLGVILELYLIELFLFIMVLSVTGFIVGIISLRTPNKKKVFGILGLMLSACPIVFMVLTLIAISNMDFGVIR